MGTLYDYDITFTLGCFTHFEACDYVRSRDRLGLSPVRWKDCTTGEYVTIGYTGTE